MPVIPSRDPRWTFGQRVPDGWQRLLRPSQEPYLLDLASHSGLIVGLSEEGSHMSQLRLVVNAARHGWKIVQFDPYGSRKRAAAFVSAIEKVHPVPESLDDVLDASSQPFDVPPATTIYDYSNAIYLNLNVWEEAQAARDTARLLLADFVRFVSRTPEQPVLLLMDHPTLLFDVEDLSPLFPLLERAGGSLFISARSVADFGREASRLLKTAHTIIVHRSTTAAPFDPYVSRLFDEAMMRQFDADECFVLHAGQATHVRVSPVLIDDVPSSAEYERDALITSLFDPQTHGDREHLRQALSFLGWS